MRHFLKNLSILGLCAILPATAQAAPKCAARDSVVAKLTSGYGETFAGGGLQNSTRIIEVWMSEEKGTFTILMTRPDGSTCIIAAGTNWREGDVLDKVPTGTPS